MKKLFFNLLKIISACIVSVIVLSILCLGYYFIPVHIENKKHNTDFTWTPNSIWIKATEGFSYGRFDANGYNNKKIIDNPDILVLGSSHTIGTQVKQEETFSSVLATKLKDKYTVYNMGMDNHTLYKNSANLKKNLELFKKTPKYVILETYTLYVLEDDVNNIIGDTYPFIQSYSDGIIGTLQKIPFFRLMYFQLTHGLSEKLLDKKVDNGLKNNLVNDDFDGNIIEIEYYDKLFSYYSELENDYNTKFIIMYHPSLIMKEDGSVVGNTNSKELSYFKYYANKYNINFLDMTNDFINMYSNEYHLPHGFNTGLLGSGHLNKYGHEKIGIALYEKILEMEN